MAKKEKQPKESKRVEICACPPGSRAATDYYDKRKIVCITEGAAPKRVVPKTCSAEARSYDVSRGPQVRALARPAVFNYSTPSGVVQIGTEARNERGCIVEHTMERSKKKAKGRERGTLYEKQTKLTYRCPPGSVQFEKTGKCVEAQRNDKGKLVPVPGGRDVEPVFDAECGGVSKPCATGRTSCPVQLVFRHGKPALRFCPPFVWKTNKKGKRHRAGSQLPGWLVPVESGQDAQKLAAEACAQWEKDGRVFKSTNPAAVEARKARIGYAGTGENKNTLGTFGRLRWR